MIFLGEDTGYTLGQQILRTTYTTVWIFTGIEGAVVISGRAESTATAGKATELSFLTLLILYVLISVLSMGNYAERGTCVPARSCYGGDFFPILPVRGGKALINIGVIISIAGAMFSYTIVTADSAFAPALLHGCFPRFLSIENKKGAPWALCL